MKSAAVDGAVLVVPGLIWGASFLFIAEGLNAVAPNGVTFARIAVGFLTLSLFPSARKPVARADWAAIAGVGVLWLAFPLSMFPFAEQHVSSALTGMLNGATPLFVAAIAALLAGRLPAGGIMVGLAVGFGGAVVMALSLATLNRLTAWAGLKIPPVPSSRILASRVAPDSAAASARPKVTHRFDGFPFEF